MNRIKERPDLLIKPTTFPGELRHFANLGNFSTKLRQKVQEINARKYLVQKASGNLHLLVFVIDTVI